MFLYSLLVNEIFYNSDRHIWPVLSVVWIINSVWSIHAGTLNCAHPGHYFLQNWFRISHTCRVSISVLSDFVDMVSTDFQ